MSLFEVLLYELGALVDDLDIGLDQFSDVWALDFYNHRRAIVKLCSMDLGKRGRGNGDLIKLREKNRYRDVKLGLQNLAYLSKRQRGRGILKLGQFGEVRLRHNVRTRGKQLAQLNKRWAEFLEHFPEVNGHVFFRKHSRMLMKILGKAEPANHPAPAVLGQDPGYLFVPAEVSPALVEHQPSSTEIEAPASESIPQTPQLVSSAGFSRFFSSSTRSSSRAILRSRTSISCSSSLTLSASAAPAW